MKKLLLLLTVITLINCKNENTNKEADVTDGTDADVTVVDETAATDDNALVDETLLYDVNKTDLKWTAYKTPEKVAVHGTFDSIVVKNTHESVIPEEVLEGATFTIYTNSMTTNDESRDAKIIGLFFNNLEENLIYGTIGKLENETVPIEIVMNNKKVTKDFKYTFENKKIVITGVIDIIEDFGAQKSFDILHDACSSLHLGKTWTDVSIEVISNLERDAQ